MSQTTADMQRSEQLIVAREGRVTNNPGSWHNPTSQPIRQLNTDIWVIERGYLSEVADIGGKTTIVRLSNNHLVIHSPLPIDHDLRQQVTTLGTVSAIICPNDQHIDFIECWKQYFPDAICIGPPGIKSKKPHLPFDVEIDVNNNVHESYADPDQSIEQIYIDGVPFMNETVFYHKPSKTLITADLCTNFPQDTSWFLKYRHVVFNALFRWLYRNVFCKDRACVEKALEKIERWPFETIVPCHGYIIEKEAKQVLMQWHGRS